MTDWINITIDGSEIQAKKGELLTDAAARAGIAIPVFCSHPKLDPLGACRMCLVEVEGPRGRALITACTTPVVDGAKYFYASDKAVDARKGTLELILINHPLDCPICDKGGECPLQNQTMEHGPGKSHFWEIKTHKAKNYPLSDLILLDQERCIVCWRCIRYLQEWEDKPQLGLFHRGGETVIDKFPGAKLDATTSGSIIDLCPVGALTNRLSRFGYRPWELDKTDSICIHCAQGCNLRIDARDDLVRRHVGRENPAVNEEWICDKGRFATGVSSSAQRLTEPLMRIDGKLQPVSWQQAVERVVQEIKTIVAKYGQAAVGAIGSAKASNEANYLLGKFMRALVGSNHVDFREGAALHADPRGIPSLDETRNADLIVLMGCDPSEEAPVLATFLKRAAKRSGAKLVIVHSRAIELTQYAGVFLQPAPGDEASLFDALTAASLKVRGETAPAWLTQLAATVEAAGGLPAEAVSEAAELLVGAKRPFIVYGSDYAWGYGSRDIVAALTNWVVAAGHGDRLGFLHSQANAQGAADMGMLPGMLPGYRAVSDADGRAELESLWQTHLPAEPGMNYGAMIANVRSQIRALYIMGADPAAEKPADTAALKALNFLVVQDLFLTETAKLATVVLPAASYAESDGTYTNMERRVQRAPRAVQSVGKSVSDWNILMHLARYYAAGQTAAWNTSSVEAVFAEIAAAVPQYAGMSWELLDNQGMQWAWDALPVERTLLPHEVVSPAVVEGYPFRLVTGNVLWDGGTVFAATPQMTGLVVQAVRLHPDNAAALGLHECDPVEIRSQSGQVKTAVHLDPTIRPGTVFVPFSLPGVPVGSLFDATGPRTSVAISKVSA